ncbi:MAG: hypothetical protein EKK39_08060 [Sphingobacteriales bacterium]|uniref:hypothetical protein n=1 Tax=Hydrotalea flava TaxID=714549 RepID=UPI0008361282|nr:hypothetical protein [Hydrotalea flava]RTL51551.1 MAG: hypothetical protein EKK39_08060 [Sphingobacteriales bacterium]
MIQEKLFATESRIMNLYKSIIDDLQKIVLSKQLLMPESSIRISMKAAVVVLLIIVFLTCRELQINKQEKVFTNKAVQ